MLQKLGEAPGPPGGLLDAAGRDASGDGEQLPLEPGPEPLGATSDEFVQPPDGPLQALEWLALALIGTLVPGSVPAVSPGFEVDHPSHASKPRPRV